MLVIFEIVSSELHLPVMEVSSAVDFDLWCDELRDEGCDPSRYYLLEVDSVDFDSV
jgi:hypothetical protein